MGYINLNKAFSGIKSQVKHRDDFREKNSLIIFVTRVACFIELISESNNPNLFLSSRNAMTFSKPSFSSFYPMLFARCNSSIAYNEDNLPSEGPNFKLNFLPNTTSYEYWLDVIVVDHDKKVIRRITVASYQISRFQ